MQVASVPAYNAMQDATVEREAKCMVVCFGIARCKTLWLGCKQSRQLASLPALVEQMRDARVGWESKPASV